jgi:hypothetical protein
MAFNFIIIIKVYYCSKINLQVLTLLKIENEFHKIITNFNYSYK